MFLGIATELAPEQRRRVAFFEIIREKETRRALPPEMPQKPLLRDTLGDPTEDPGFGAPERTARLMAGMSSAPFLLCFGEHREEALLHPVNEPIAGRIPDGLLGLVRHFAIELVALTTDRHQVHVHTTS